MPATDPVSLAIAGAAATVALCAAWFQRPIVPELDGERWFKTALATVLRGDIEHRGGDAAAWERAVLAFVPYHPAGRFPERKITNPAAHPTERRIEGETALLAALARTDDVQRRWAILYDQDERGVEARLADPIELGASYAPSGAAGAGATWNDVARWSHDPAFGERLQERLNATWVLVDGHSPRLVPALASLCGDKAIRISEVASLKAQVEAIATRPSSRIVFVAEGDGIGPVLQLLVDHPGLRDQVLAVVSVGGNVGGRPQAEGASSEAVRQDWMGAWFGQEHLDTEKVRLTPYMSVQWLDRGAWPPGTASQPLHLARFPAPSRQKATVDTIESVDLGVLPHTDLPLDLVAKALVFTVCGWVASRS